MNAGKLVTSLALLGSLTLGAPKDSANWPVIGDGEFRTNVLVADFDKNKPGSEVFASSVLDLTGFPKSNIYCWDKDGNLLSGYPANYSSPIPGAPASADLDGDGNLEIVFATQDNTADSTKWTVYALNPTNPQTPLWSSSTENESKEITTFRESHNPTLADLDGDGKVEVVLGGGNNSNKLYVFNNDGSYYQNSPFVGNSADDGFVGPVAVGDINGDGKLDIVAGSKKYLHAVSFDGSELPSWPATVELGQETPVYGAISLADVNGDGELEIFCTRTDMVLHAFDSQGKAMSGWPSEQYTINLRNPASFGDIDNDGNLEIITKAFGMAHAFKYDGTRATNWPVYFNVGVPTHSAGNWDALLADIDGDGVPEVISTAFNAGSGDAATSGKLFVWKGDGTLVSGYPVELEGVPNSGITMTDFEGDGHAHLIYGSKDGKIYIMDLGPNTYHPESSPWMAPRHDNQRTGNYHWGRPSAIRDEKSPVPTSYRLMQNYPNPFNPSTNVEFDLPRSGEVNLSVYNILGQKVRTLESGKFRPGHYKSAWDGSAENGKAAPSGVYLLNLKVNDYSTEQKMLLVR